MKPRSFLVGVFAAVLPAIAAAQQAHTINAVAMRAGPDREYPFVASYGPGTPLTVQGCIEGYRWCDVIGPNGYRGWVHGGDIGYLYQRRQIPVLSYGPGDRPSDRHLRGRPLLGRALSASRPVSRARSLGALSAGRAAPAGAANGRRSSRTAACGGGHAAPSR